MNQKLLEDLGLTKGEAIVYFTLLRLGETTTGKIVKEAQISSGKIYEILEKLIRKGLVSYILKGKTKYFIASSPNRIIDYIHEKENELKKREEEMLKELPLLLALDKSAKKEYETQLFKGFKGIQTAIFEALDMLSQKDEVLAMGIRSKKGKQYNLLWQRWHRERIQKRIICKAIFSDKNTEYYHFFKKKYVSIKTIKHFFPKVKWYSAPYFFFTWSLWNW